LLLLGVAATGSHRLPVSGAAVAGGLLGCGLLVAAAVWIGARRGWRGPRGPRMRRLAAGIAPALVAVRALGGAKGVRLLGLSLVLWVLEALVYMGCAHAVGVSIGWMACVYVMCFSNLAGTIPAA